MQKAAFATNTRSPRLRIVLAMGLALSGPALAGCAKEGDARPGSVASQSDVDLPAVLATIGGEPVTLEDVRGRVGDQLVQMETQYKRARSRAIETTLQEILRERILDAEAKKQGKTVDELVVAEAGGTFEPSEIEMSSWYQENQGSVGGRTLEQVRSQIADLLRPQKRTAAEKKLEQRLNQERKVTINFQPYRLTFNNEGAPSLGKPGAPVTVVEFSDFQCPFCRSFAPNLKQIEKEFGDKVHVVYRQYPIPSIHPFAIKAAEASLCANDQGKFWELHDVMFGDQKKLSVSDLKEQARRLGMDQKKFATCLDTGRYTERVQNDMKEGARAGVTGTPAVFVNGVEVPGGAVPYQTVADAIQKELSRAARAN